MDNTARAREGKTPCTIIVLTVLFRANIEAIHTIFRQQRHRIPCSATKAMCFQPRHPLLQVDNAKSCLSGFPVPLDLASPQSQQLWSRILTRLFVRLELISFSSSLDPVVLDVVPNTPFTLAQNIPTPWITHHS